MLVLGELTPGEGVTISTTNNYVSAISDTLNLVIIQQADIIYSSILYSQGAVLIDEPNLTLSLVS